MKNKQPHQGVSKGMHYTTLAALLISNLTVLALGVLMSNSMLGDGMGALVYNNEVARIQKASAATLLARQKPIRIAPIDPAPVLPSPTAPSNLIAAASSQTSVNLWWTDNASNEDGFKIERATGTATTTPMLVWGQIGVAPKTDGTRGTYADRGAMPNSNYTYRVRAYNGYGDSGYTNEAVAGTPGDMTPPSVPAWLIADPISSTQINLAWATSTDAGGSGLGGYYVYRSLFSGGPYMQISTSILSRYYDTGRVASTTYYYVVRSFDNAGNASANSNQAQATTW